MGRPACCADLQKVCERIRHKEKDYLSYNFSQAQNILLRTFFDLSQEFESIEDFYRVCVAGPLECMGLDCELYLADEKRQAVHLVCSCREGLLPTPRPAQTCLRLIEKPYAVEGCYVIPLLRWRADGAEGADAPDGSRVMGFFVVADGDRLPESDRFFLRKYANRIATHLHNRLLALQHIQHLKFINSLVMDIEHNVIVPNMYFRHLFNNLKKSIAEIEALETTIVKLKQEMGVSSDACRELLDRVSHLHGQLLGQHHELQEHHATTSLFLESLFRRDHFVQGHLVLRPRYCRVEDEIIGPQLEHFAGRFKVRGITVEAPTDMIGEEVLLVVDVGLLSQVYANFFSNALKYVEEIIDHRNKARKAVAYGREIIRDCFGPGRHGIKFNVFTTGRHLSDEEAAAVFNEGFRSVKYRNLPGTGHGLAFVKQVIEIHGGVVGYERTPEGNNFFFVLPLPEADSPLSEILARSSGP